ncbi:unnamed protein product [Withania somnifera]
MEIWYATSEYLRQEMNPNFRMTYPFNPSSYNQFARRTLFNEYIISCYGARKGVVDTAVRTSDAGYLTRRLVEVVQHIVVRRTDCGTGRGISMTDDIYMGPRCIATRNQDIGIGLVNRFITFRAQPISIRTPFTCRSTSWICRLSVGIIAGQSIGEPGTQLILRTFHTGGVFTGYRERVRAPSNGKIKFNEDLVHPTRTRHGNPAFLCSIDLYVTIESEDILHNVNIPPKSLLLVQNDQYVESNKESLKTYLFDSDGEMHRSTDVSHAPKFTYGNVHLLPKTSHLWILLGGPCGSGLVYLSIHKDRDQMNAHSLSGKRRYTSNLSVTEDRIPDYSDLNRIICTGRYNLVYSLILHENSIYRQKELENELMPRSCISIEIPVNGIFRRNSNLSYFDDPRYEERDLIEYRGVKEFRSKYQMKVDRFFFIPEEVHILPGSSSIMVRNNSIVGVDTQITLNLRSRVGGLVRTGKRNSKESKKVKNWIYVQRITPSKKRFFVLVRPVVTYEIMDGINLATLFPPDLLLERDNVQLRIVNYILYGNGKPIRGISTQVFNYSCEEARASFVEIRTNGLIRHFLRINLVKSPFRKSEKRMIRRGRIALDNGSIEKIQQSLNQPQGTIHTLLNRNKESQSLIIFSAANCSRMGPFKDVKYHGVIKESIKKDSQIPIRNSLGPLGTCLTIENFYSSYHLITHNRDLMIKFKYYLMDENGNFFNPYPCRNIILNPFNLNWSFLHHNYCEETSKIISLGQFICENVCIAKNGPPLKSGQVILVQVDSIVIRSAKPYLATPSNRDILVTFIYEKLRSGDITQVFQKWNSVRHSIDSISMNLEKRVEGWNKCITRILGIPWGFLIGAELTIAQSRISLVNKIQQVYRSLGVRIHNRHIEIIVQDGMSNIFSPGELIGLLRAERMGRALEEAICYRVVLLGIIRASLNTQSFISEASFQETARNVVLGGVIPVGTGFKGLVHPSKQHNNIPLETKKESIRGEMRDILFHHVKLFDSCLSKKFHDIPKQSFIGFNDS